MSKEISANTEMFKQSFREEAREILADLEAALLELKLNPRDMELAGRVFRSLHTIEGSAAMFGFERLAAFAHNLELAFDLVRKGRLAMGPELIGLTLAALDPIAAMLEEDASGRLSANRAAGQRILESVRRLAGMEETNGQETESESAPLEQPVTPERRTWRIDFAPGPDLIRYGADPLLLLHKLRSLGSLCVRAVMDAVPPLTELDPERCYVRWELELNTLANREAIRDVFIFVEGACALSIELASDPAPKGADAEPACEAGMAAPALEEKRSGTSRRRSQDEPDNASSLRVPAARLDRFVDLVGELAILKARLSELAARRDDAEMTAVCEDVARLTTALRDSAMNLRTP